MSSLPPAGLRVTRLWSRALQTNSYRIGCGVCGLVVEVMPHGDAAAGTPHDSDCLAATRTLLRRAHATCAPPQAA